MRFLQGSCAAAEPPRRLCRLACIAALAVAGFLTPSASAQFGELAGFTEAMNPEYLTRDLVIFAETLELDKPQKDVLENLYADYKLAFEEGLDGMQERLKDMKKDFVPNDQKRILQLIFVPFEDWAKDRRKLGEEFIRNLEIILNEQQQQLLPAFQRRLVRDKTLSRGVLSGESLNLLLVIKQMRLSQPVSLTVDPVLNEYEMALHSALETRNGILRNAQSKTVEALQEQNGEKNLVLMDRQINARIDVRGINDRFIDLITASLPAEHGAAFYAAAMQKAYSKAYRSSPGERMFDDALKLPLDEGIMESIIGIRDLYLDELLLFRQNLVDVIRSYEPKRERNRVEMFTARMAGEKPVKLPDPTLAEVRKRDKLDDVYIEMLQALLTPEEFAMLTGAERWMARKDNKERAKGEKVVNREQMREKQRHPGRDALRGSKSGAGAPGGLGSSPKDR